MTFMGSSGEGMHNPMGRMLGGAMAFVKRAGGHDGLATAGGTPALRFHALAAVRWARFQQDLIRVLTRTLVPHERQAALEFRRQVSVVRCHVYGLAGLLAEPGIELFWCRGNEASLAVNRHAFCGPALDDRGGLAEEVSDLLPA